MALGSTGQGDDAYLSGSASSTQEGWSPQLSEDYEPGKVPDAGDAWVNADTWKDNNPGQQKNTYPFTSTGPGGDGFNGILNVPGSDLGDPTQTNHVSSNYRYDNGAPNRFPRGTGPDYQGQTLRGYALNANDIQGINPDYEGPNKGPLWKPRIHPVGSMTPDPVGDESKATGAPSARHSLEPDPRYLPPLLLSNRNDPTGGSSPSDD